MTYPVPIVHTARAALRAAAVPGEPADVAAAVRAALADVSGDMAALTEVIQLCARVVDQARQMRDERSVIPLDREPDTVPIYPEVGEPGDDTVLPGGQPADDFVRQRSGTWTPDTEPTEKVPGRSSAWFDAGQSRASSGVNVPELAGLPEVVQTCPGCDEPISMGQSIIFEVATGDGVRHVQCEGRTLS